MTEERRFGRERFGGVFTKWHLFAVSSFCLLPGCLASAAWAGQPVLNLTMELIPSVLSQADNSQPKEKAAAEKTPVEQEAKPPDPKPLQKLFHHAPYSN